MKRALVVASVLVAGFAACVRSEIGGPGNGSHPMSSSDGGGAGGSHATPGEGTGAAAGAGQETPGTGGALPDSTACGQRTVDDCAQGSTCAVLNGQRITGSPACALPAEPIACGTNQGCAMATVRATDPKGVDWLFPTTCIPAGWIDNSSKGTRFDTCPTPAGGNPASDAGTPDR